MGWRDFLGGGLFGGYGGYDQLSEEARQRANRRGLMTSGALIMGNSVGPENMGFMRNISSALLAGREDFESVLEREAQLAAIAERKKKLEDLELEKIRMEEEEKEREFQEWQEKEALRTQRLHTVSSKTGKTVEELQALGEGSLGGLYEDILFPKPEKKPYKDIVGGLEIMVHPDGSKEFIRDLTPPKGREPKTPEEIEADNFAKRERFIQGYVDDLARIADTEDKFDPSTGAKVGVIRTPRYTDLTEMRRLALEEWDKSRSPFYGTRGGGSTSAGTAPPLVPDRPSPVAPPSRALPVSGAPSVPPPQPSSADIQRTKELIDREGLEKASEMLMRAADTPEEAAILLRLATASVLHPSNRLMDSLTR